MPIVIETCSQKGGVGKSTLARLIAREYANAGWAVKIADLDVGQGPIFHWQGRRLQNCIEPIIPVERFGAVEQALKLTAGLDFVVIDAPPNANAGIYYCPYDKAGDLLWDCETWMPDASRDGSWPDVVFYGCKGSPLSWIPEHFSLATPGASLPKIAGFGLI